MKKYFPVIIFVMVFSGFLAGQIAFDLIDISAGPSSEERAQLTHYQNVFKNLRLKTTEGKEIKLIEEKAPVVVLNFWASWCRPCLEEFPSLVELQEKFGKEKLLVVGINNDEENQLKAISKTVKKYNLNFPIVPDKGGKVVNEFMIDKIPVSIIYNRGKVLEVSNGSKDFVAEELLEKIREAIQENPKS